MYKLLNVQSVFKAFHRHWMMLLVMGLTICTGAYRLEDCSIWMDEYFSINIAQRSLGEIWSLTRHGNDGFYFNKVPPLYETFIHFLWFSSGQNVILVRWFSIICYTLTIWLIFRIATRMIDKNAGLLAAFLASLNYGYIYYGKMIRWYSMLNVLCLCSFYFFLKVTEAGRNWKRYLFLLTVVNVMIFYTSYFGAIIMLVEALGFFLLLKGKFLWRSLLVLAGSFVMSIPWWSRMMCDLKTERAIESIDYTLVFFLNMMGMRFNQGIFKSYFLTALYLVVVGAMLFLCVKSMLKKEKKYSLMLVLLSMFCIPVLIINFLTVNVFEDYSRGRYLLCFLFPVFIAMAFVITRASKIVGTLMLGLVMAVSVNAAYGYLTCPRSNFWDHCMSDIAIKAKEFYVPSGDKLVVEIEDQFFVPVFIYYFYGKEYFREVSMPHVRNVKLAELSYRMNPNHYMCFSVAGIKPWQFLYSVPAFMEADWLFVVHSSWLATCWGKPFMEVYHDKVKQYGLERNLQLVHQEAREPFFLNIYKVIK